MANNDILKETSPLSAKEQQLLPFIQRGLERRIGKENAITSEEICRLINNFTQDEKKRIEHGYPDYKLSRERLRLFINHIRRKDLISWVIASQDGYYVTRDPAEALDQAERMERKANAELDAARGLRESVNVRAMGKQSKMF